MLIVIRSTRCWHGVLQNAGSVDAVRIVVGGIGKSLTLLGNACVIWLYRFCACSGGVIAMGARAMMLTVIWRRVAAIFFIFLWFGHPAHGQEVSDEDRFSLWNNCDGIELIVEELSDDVDAIFLTKDEIEYTVRARLRGARIYREETSWGSFIYVNVNVFRNAFSINIQLNKPVHDTLSGLEYFASTWGTYRMGTHGGDSNYILSTVARNTDQFIDEYLRVNAAAC